MKIKVKVFNPICKPYSCEKGDWIDLTLSEDVTMAGPISLRARRADERKVIFDSKVLHLGVAMQLPKGYEAVINPRSGTFGKYGIILTNSQGVIDNSYCGDEDQWRAHVIATRDTELRAGTRLFQFRVQLSQRATVWQKIKNLFSCGIKFEYVENLNNRNRGGFGSTGI